MVPVRVPPPLRARLGDQASEALLDMVHESGREWRDELWERLADRFEQRMSEEISHLRVDISAMRVEILRWSFAFWITQLTALAVFAYMK